MGPSPNESQKLANGVVGVALLGFGTESKRVPTSPNEPPKVANGVVGVAQRASEIFQAWARAFFKKHPLSKGRGIDDMERQFKAVLMDCAAYINENYDVDALCRSFPERLKEMISVRRERLS